MNRKHFYYNQLVTEEDLNNAFTDVEAGIAARATAMNVFGILKGMGVYLPNSGSPTVSTVTIKAGLALDKKGSLIPAPVDVLLDLSLTTAGASTAVVASGKERWVSVFAKWGRLRTDQKTDGNGNLLYYNQADGLSAKDVTAAEQNVPSSVPFDLVPAGTPPESTATGGGQPGPTGGEGSYLIVVGEEADVGTAVRPALDASAVLIADFKRTYNSTGVTVSLKRTEYALQGLAGYIQNAQVEDAEGLQTPAKYRQIFGAGAAAVNADGRKVRIYLRTAIEQQYGAEPAGGIVIAQGCSWDNDLGRWVGDTETGATSAGAIVLHPNGSVALCWRSTAVSNTWLDAEGGNGTEGWHKTFTLTGNDGFPEEAVHMSMFRGGIRMTRNGANTYQRAILGCGMYMTDASMIAMMATATWPQPFATVPSSVTASTTITGAADHNVGNLSNCLIAITEVGVVAWIPCSIPASGELLFARELRGVL